MRNRVSWLGAVALVVLSVPASAQTKDAAELLPAQTLAYVELRHPERLSREVAALVKGSALENLPARMARRRTLDTPDMMNWRLREELGILSLFLSPEMIDEAGRIRGGFVALTGFSKENTPEIVGVLQPGSSNFPGLYMRGYLSMEARAHLVGEVEGVSLFQERRRMYFKAAGPTAPAFKDETSGPVMAQMPGMLIFGSSVPAVTDVIRRARGKSADASLASLRAYRDAVALRERPGLFAYADVSALAAHLDALAKSGRPVLPIPWGTWKTILQPEAVRGLTASLTLHNGNLEWLVRADLTGRGTSPLLALLPDKPAPRELLHFAPSDTLLAMTAGLGDGEQRWKTVLNLLDELARQDGQREINLPSKNIREMEEKAKLQIGKDVLAPLTGAALVMDVEKDRDKLRGPMLILHAVNAEAARALEERGLPKLLGLTSGEAVKPTQEEIDGQPIRSVTGAHLLGRLPLHYGRRGAVLVLGPDRKRVAAVLTGGARKKGLMGETKIAEAIKEVEPSAVLVGVVPPGQALAELFTYLGTPAPNMPRQFKGPAPVPPPPQPAKLPEGTVKAIQEMRKVVEPLPPLVFSLSRQPDGLVLQLRQTGLRRVTPRVLDVWVESVLDRTLPGPGGIGAGGRAAREEAVRQALKEAEQAAVEAKKQADKARAAAEEARKKREQEKKKP